MVRSRAHFDDRYVEQIEEKGVIGQLNEPTHPCQFVMDQLDHVFSPRPRTPTLLPIYSKCLVIEIRPTERIPNLTNLN